ncbi:YbaK/EbsC family protein [Acetomicrobium sp.]|jgi:Cys-tRNA(Pro) deacylase|uniref:YbaK/EbsC family protein n=1 Tax=Acetomicrobium sp. TaxID=1872099 RepID=UPI002B258CBB|nr:YbaK/EbsC family protein [Acetomicrobium sp.]
MSCNRHYTEEVQRVWDDLKSLGYSGEIFVSDHTIFTVEDASKAIGVPEEQILKSLIFLVDDEPVLVLMSGPNKVDIKKVRKHLGARKVKMAGAEYIEENFGYKIGGVPPIGYDVKIKTLIDEDVQKYEILWAAAGNDHAFFPVSPDELVRITGGLICDLKKE